MTLRDTLKVFESSTTGASRRRVLHVRDIYAGVIGSVTIDANDKIGARVESSSLQKLNSRAPYGPTTELDEPTRTGGRDDQRGRENGAPSKTLLLVAVVLFAARRCDAIHHRPISEGSWNGGNLLRNLRGPRLVAER